jgi:hypothetical protein
MIAHLVRQHAITENSPARAENDVFANPLMNSFFPRLQNITFSTEEWDRLTVEYIIEGKLPLTTVELPSFSTLINYARLSPHAEIKIAGADTLRNRMLRYFDQTFEKVKSILKAQDWISYTTDVWTSPWKASYMGITAHWIDSDWKKKDVLIAFSPILGSHTGNLPWPKCFFVMYVFAY